MIKEYLKLIPNGIENAPKIWDGIKNEVKSVLGNLSEDEQEEITKRRFICSVCQFNSSNAVANPALNYKTDRIDEHCIFCQCNIHVKTASLISKCGIEVHNKNHPEFQMDLKWEEYKKPIENGKEN